MCRIFSSPHLNIGVLSLVAAFIVASASSLGGTPLAAAASVDFSLQTSTNTLEVGDRVDVTIQFDASNDPVSAAQAYLDFDPAVLRVVDGDGNPVTTINQGQVFADHDWEELQNSVDNTAGEIDFAGGKKPETGSDATGSAVEFATFKFEVQDGASGTTTVSFSSTAPRETKAVSGFTLVTGALEDLELTVAESPVDMTFSFSVQGQDSGSVPTWSMDAFEVEFYEEGTTNLVRSEAPPTAPSTSNSSTFEVTDVSPGKYDIWVKGENTLSQLHPAVTISQSSSSYDLGEQKGGDATGEGGPPDNVVDGQDYSALLGVFGTDTSTLTDSEQLNDHNWDGIVDVSDHGIVVENFEDSGDPKPGS